MSLPQMSGHPTPIFTPKPTHQLIISYLHEPNERMQTKSDAMWHPSTRRTRAALRARLGVYFEPPYIVCELRAKECPTDEQSPDVVADRDRQTVVTVGARAMKAAE